MFLIICVGVVLLLLLDKTLMVSSISDIADSYSLNQNKESCKYLLQILSRSGTIKYNCHSCLWNVWNFFQVLNILRKKRVEQKISTFKSLKVRSILLIFASISRLFLGLKSHTAFYTPIVFVYNSSCRLIFCSATN